MKLLIVCSKQFYSRIDEIKKGLEERGIDVLLPNTYTNPGLEQEMWNQGEEAHREFKSRMFKMSEDKIKNSDGVLVLNFDKEKDGILYKNYIGGATFLEMYDAFRMNKKIFMYNGIPDGMLYDEIDGFNPILINGNLDLIK
jgi:hypothetical protein